MEYVELDFSNGTKRMIPNTLANWRAPYNTLFNQTYTSGYEAWLAYSYNNFDNQFQKTDEKRYQKRGGWAEIFRDTMRSDSPETNEGLLPVVYVSYVGIEGLERTYEVPAPPDGWVVPSEKDIRVKEKRIWIPYHPGTLVPYKTVPDRLQAEKMLTEEGIPINQVSFFERRVTYLDNFVGRTFNPDRGGRFFVDYHWQHNDPGYFGAASRPLYEEGEADIVMRINVPEIVSAAR